MPESVHKPVLLQESIEGLDLAPGKLLIDGTFGAGGHSKEARRRHGEELRIVGLDRDPSVAAKHPEFEVKTLNFAKMGELGLRPDAILLDLGFSSDQLETGGKGLSFLRDEPLDMRLSGEGFTAADVVNSWDEEALELILRGFGEEKYSKRIAKAIALRRETKPFATTAELVETIESAMPASQLHARIHPATRTFQALRIAVNEELTNLERALENGFSALQPGGRFAVISFHSLEDRMVKNFFRDKAREGEVKLITKKPLTPSEAEIAENPRARSAKLRIIKKL